MKKYLLIIFTLFSLFIFDNNVYAASELYDYMFTTATVVNNGTSYSTGSRNPGNPGAETNFTYFSFGYYNLSTTFQPGQKWRITADYCTSDNNYLNNYRDIGHSGITNYNLTYTKGGSCVYTSPSGVVSVGSLISFQFDFEIDPSDYTTGWVKYEFFLSSAKWHWVAFKDYRIYPSSEITDSDNTQNIIDNSNKNQQQTNEKLDNLNKTQQETNDYLKDNTAPSSDISSLGNVQGLLKPGPVDSLLNIPFKFLSVVTSSCSGTCTPLTGKFVFDSDLSIPCFSDLFYKNVPDVLMNFINLIPSAFILIQYFKHLYKKVDRAVSMESNSDDEWGVL